MWLAPLSQIKIHEGGARGQGLGVREQGLKGEAEELMIHAASKRKNENLCVPPLDFDSEIRIQNR